MVDGNFLPARGGFLQFIRRGNICRAGLAASAAVSALRSSTELFDIAFFAVLQ